MKSFVKMLLLSMGVLAVASLVPLASASAAYVYPVNGGLYNGGLYNGGLYNGGLYNNYSNYVNPDNIYNAINNGGFGYCITRPQVVSALGRMNFAANTYAGLDDFYNYLSPTITCVNFTRDNLASLLVGAGVLDNNNRFIYVNNGLNGGYLNNYGYGDGYLYNNYPYYNNTFRNFNHFGHIDGRVGVGRIGDGRIGVGVGHVDGRVGVGVGRIGDGRIGDGRVNVHVHR